MYGQKVILPSSETETFRADPRFEKLAAEGPKACNAMSGDLRCYLDNIHLELKTDHVHRNSDGSLVSFRS
jgi:hypothetical protein